MNREIKFRAWYGGKMVYDFAVIDGVAMREESPKRDCIVRGEDGTIGYTDWATYRPLQDAILMQFTGLKDKNGVEIFEGDIITFSDGFNALVKDIREINKQTTNVCAYYNGYAVIGNIHDNPELLK